MAVPNPIVLIMAGGSGTRFWPMSTRSCPKQFLRLVEGGTLIQQTVQRLVPLVKPSNIFVCAAHSHEALIREQLPVLGGLILEPLARNTTACLMLSVATFLERGVSLETPMIAVPADHFVGRADRFQEIVSRALAFSVERESLVTLGIQPTTPHTGYGYIEASPEGGTVSPVRRFIEKPDRKTAEGFLKLGGFYWNAGVFVWTLRSITNAFEAYQGEDWAKVQRAVSDSSLDEVYPTLPSVPIDISVMERARNVFMIRAEGIDWTDLGSWNSLYELVSSDNAANLTLSGRAKFVGSRGCLVKAAEGRKVAVVGVDDLIVVENEEGLLITHRLGDQGVREAASEFDP